MVANSNPRNYTLHMESGNIVSVHTSFYLFSIQFHYFWMNTTHLLSGSSPCGNRSTVILDVVCSSMDVWLYLFPPKETNCIPRPLITSSCFKQTKVTVREENTGCTSERKEELEHVCLALLTVPMTAISCFCLCVCVPAYSGAPLVHPAWCPFQSFIHWRRESRSKDHVHMPSGVYKQTPTEKLTVNTT